ncbi:TlpA family protein disulfide reductase [Aromatoleum sp.]|uniref:TlpA family protein disulfide reductase n=1 Tax=Aromatoleum sp. TaxID=2307007 RepID=UPI002FC85D08
MKAILVALLLSLSLATPASAATPGEVPVGGLLRDAEMRGLSGKPATLADFRGKPLIINVWASWCAPCRDEMASLDRLARRYGGGKHFNVIGISTDDYSDRAKAFLQQANTSFPHFIDSRLFLENMLGADRIPLTLLIDADGRILHKIYGAKEWDSPEAVKAIGQAFGAKL